MKRGYNDLYCDQLTELLTQYGPLTEVWFDGANGEGPNGKRQVYDWPRVWALVRRLQPEAVMFSDAGPDVRWCGNEKGSAGDPNWSTVDPAAVRYPGASGPGVTAALQHGDPAGSVCGQRRRTRQSGRDGFTIRPRTAACERSRRSSTSISSRSAGIRSCCSTCRRHPTGCCTPWTLPASPAVTRATRSREWTEVPGAYFREARPLVTRGSIASSRPPCGAFDSSLKKRWLRLSRSALSCTDVPPAFDRRWHWIRRVRAHRTGCSGLRDLRLVAVER
jgi:hypothetical protein